MEGTFLGPSILMGRMAAQTVAAAQGKRNATPLLMTELRTTPPAAHPRFATACEGCHDLPKMIAANRQGYWHFEQAHKLVLSRSLNCMGCHAEMTPFRAANHKINRELQTTVCQHCHMSSPFAGRRAAASE